MKSAIGIWKNENDSIKASGLWKEERPITTPQSPNIATSAQSGMINMCANNYLGLCDDPRVKEAAAEALEKWGYGLSSVRFICGTQTIHKELEAKLSAFLETEDTILYSSCFDANGGLFECLTMQEDAIISDELNHASIIDGVRLSKATRYRYKNNDMRDLEAKLNEAAGARIKMIVTDGVFSMDGTVADLKSICLLAEKYDAAVVVDDSHGVGVLGERGRGAHEYNGVVGKIDVITGTLGKALGGASGGYTSGNAEIIALLRQRSRPYLFSNSLSPVITAASIKIIEMLSEDISYKTKLDCNTEFFRKKLKDAGFEVPGGPHPIIPIMLGEAQTARRVAELMMEKSVYVTAFFYPVVPKGKARIRTQVNAAHTFEQLEYVANAFAEARKELT